MRRIFSVILIFTLVLLSCAAANADEHYLRVPNSMTVEVGQTVRIVIDTDSTDVSLYPDDPVAGENPLIKLDGYDITGLAEGDTGIYVLVMYADNSFLEDYFTVTVVAAQPPQPDKRLNVSPTDLTLKVGESATLAIDAGSGSYSISADNANVKIDGDKIEGVTVGDTKVLVVATYSDSDELKAEVNVKVVPADSADPPKPPEKSNPKKAKPKVTSGNVTFTIPGAIRGNANPANPDGVNLATTDTTLNMRDTDGAIVGYVRPGELAIVLSDAGDGRVNAIAAGGIPGSISNGGSLLIFNGFKYQRYVTETTYLRKGPATTFGKVLDLNKGDAVYVTSESDGWTLCTRNDFCGYVRTAYLSETQPDALKKQWLYAKTGAIMYEEADTVSGKLKTFSATDSVLVISRSGDWTECTSEDITGYIQNSDLLASDITAVTGSLGGDLSGGDSSGGGSFYYQSPSYADLLGYTFSAVGDIAYQDIFLVISPNAKMYERASTDSKFLKTLDMNETVFAFNVGTVWTGCISDRTVGYVQMSDHILLDDVSDDLSGGGEWQSGDMTKLYYALVSADGAAPGLGITGGEKKADYITNMSEHEDAQLLVEMSVKQECSVTIGIYECQSAYESTLYQSGEVVQLEANDIVWAYKATLDNDAIRCAAPNCGSRRFYILIKKQLLEPVKSDAVASGGTVAAQADYGTQYVVATRSTEVREGPDESFAIIAKLSENTEFFGTKVANTKWVLISKCDSNVDAVGGYISFGFVDESESGAAAAIVTTETQVDDGAK